MPVRGHVSNPLLDLSQDRRTNDTASVGHYKSSLANGIDIELAATAHAGMYRYNFPQGNSSIVVDVSHVLPSFRGFGWGQEYSGGSFQLTETGYTGYGVYNGGWNLAPDWTIYFCGHFDQPAVSRKTFTSVNDAGKNTTLSSYDSTTSMNGTFRQGAVFTFDVDNLTSRVGVSFISSDKACSNVEAEIAKGTSLQSLVDKAQKIWNEDVFRKVSTTETNSTILKQLYSYLYGMRKSSKIGCKLF